MTLQLTRKKQMTTLSLDRLKSHELLLQLRKKSASQFKGLDAVRAVRELRDRKQI